MHKSLPVQRWTGVCRIPENAWCHALYNVWWVQVQGVAKFVANRNLPPALKEDISRHLEGSQLIRKEQGEEDVSSPLSHTLQVCQGLHTMHTRQHHHGNKKEMQQHAIKA